MSLCEFPVSKLSVRTVSGVALSLHFFMKVVILYKKNYYINLVFSLDSLSFVMSTSAHGTKVGRRVSSPMLYGFPTAAATDYHNLAAEKMAQTLSYCPGASMSKRAPWAEIKRWQHHMPSGVSNSLLAAFSSFSAPGSFCCPGSQWLQPGSFSSPLLSLWLLLQLAW